MMTVKAWLAAAMLLAGSEMGAAAQLSPADLLIINARIKTMDAAAPTAEAVAVRVPGQGTLELQRTATLLNGALLTGLPRVLGDGRPSRAWRAGRRR